jgi:pentatricopeptide repeat protein
MLQDYHAGDTSMHPDHVSYTTILTSFAKAMMYEKAESLLWEMVEGYVEKGYENAEPRTREFFPIVSSSIF